MDGRQGSTDGGTEINPPSSRSSRCTASYRPDRATQRPVRHADGSLCSTSPHQTSRATAGGTHARRNTRFVSRHPPQGASALVTFPASIVVRMAVTRARVTPVSLIRHSTHNGVRVIAALTSRASSGSHLVMRLSSVAPSTSVMTVATIGGRAIRSNDYVSLLLAVLALKVVRRGARSSAHTRCSARYHQGVVPKNCRPSVWLRARVGRNRA